jgi:hypothetical protein
LTIGSHLFHSFRFSEVVDAVEAFTETLRATMAEQRRTESFE